MDEKLKPLKVLGVLGGMGPAASAEFMRLLAAMCPAVTDQQHPKVILYSDPQIPDRSSAILGKGPDPTEELKDGLLKLMEWGADILAVPCNTAHLFIDTFKDDLKLPLVHIVESSVALCRDRNPGGAWLLGTEGTLKCGIYQDYAARIGYSFYEPDEARRREVQKCINMVKANRVEESGKLLKGVVGSLWEERRIPVMTACTELPLSYDASGLPRDMSISSLAALAMKSLERIYAMPLSGAESK